MLRKKVTLAVVFALCLQLVVPFFSAQAIVEPYDLSRLVREAGGIVWGHVLNVAPHWNADHTYIHSTVTLSANQYLKGLGAREFALEIPGGEVDGITQWVEDAPVFAIGEEVVVFLDAERQAVVGWDQGKFSCIDGRVVEKEMLPLLSFFEEIQAELDAQGYVRPDAAIEQGLDGGAGMQFITATLDPERDGIHALPNEDKLEGSADLAVERDDAYSIIKSETFEGVWPGTGWAVAGPNPVWDDTSYREFSGSWSAWCAESTLNAPGPYANNMNSWMIYGPFSLVGATDADVWFWYWLKSQADQDWLAVMSSTDGSYFSGYKISGDRTGASGNINGWNKWDFSLTNRLGQAQVWVAVTFTSNASTVYEGAYVDDFVIWKASGTGNPPVINNVNPTSRSAGTSSQVTLWGRSFGATQGTSTVKFWHNGAWTTAPIVSWSDTKVVCRVPAPASSHSSQGLKLTTSAGTGYFGFTISFSYHGWKWPSVAMPRFYIGAGTADCTGEVAALRQASYTWSNVDYIYYALKYFGSTSKDAPVNDGYNVLKFGSTGGSIATCTTWYSGSNILEFDVVFNDAYLWNSSSTCPADRMDVQNIGTHELGHGGVGFYDLYGAADSEKTMYGYGANGETKKRSLYSTDISGIQWIY